MMSRHLVWILLVVITPYCIYGEIEDRLTFSGNATCSFEEDCCGWSPCDNIDGQWRREENVTCVNDSCIGAGFELYGTKGAYMYVSTQSVHTARYNRTILQSPYLLSSNSPQCFTFLYNMFGSQGAPLNVVLDNNQSRRMVWSNSGHQGNDWREGKITINETRPYQIIFEAAHLAKASTTVAVDELKHDDGPCYNNESSSDNVTCSFDEGCCQWGPCSISATEWQRETVSLCGSACHGPGFDKTDNGNGGYMYVAAAKNGIPSNAEMQTSWIHPSNGTQCFSFYYHMFGIHVGTLHVYKGDAVQTAPIWSRSGSQDNVWKEARLTLREKEYYEIIFKAFMLNKNVATIAIDGTRIEDGPCQPPLPGDCDFDDGFCNWKAGDDWQIADNKILKRSGGPGTDHTTETTGGRVALYFPSSPVSHDFKPIIPNNALASPSTSASNDVVCLQFWYFIKKSELSSLSISKVDSFINPINQSSGNLTDGQSKGWTHLASNSGVQNQWTYAEVTVEKSDSPFQFFIEGITQQDRNEVIAIDDVRIMDKFNCEYPDHCNFNQGFCDWEQVPDPVTDARWLRSNGGDNNGFQNVPKKDNWGVDSGFFLFVDVWSFKAGSTAMIRRFILQPEYARACFRMYYNIYVSHAPIGFLNVTVRYVYKEEFSVFHRINETGGKWLLLQENIKAKPPFEIRIKAITDSGSGYIAINDVSITPGLCNFETPTSTSDIKTSKSTRKDTIFTHSAKTNTADPDDQQTTELTKPVTHPFTPDLETSNATPQIAIETSMTTAQVTPEPSESSKSTLHATTEPAKSSKSTLHATPEPAENLESTLQATTEPAESSKTTLHVTPEPAESSKSTFYATPEPAESSRSTTLEPEETSITTLHATTEYVESSKSTLYVTPEPAESSKSTLHVTPEPAENTKSTLQATTEPAESSKTTVHATLEPEETSISTLHATTEYVESSKSTLYVTPEPAESSKSTYQATTTPETTRMTFEQDITVYKSTSTNSVTTKNTVTPSHTLPITESPSFMLDCGDDDNTQVLKLYLCDGFGDCPNGRDEENCGGVCIAHYYYCSVMFELSACVRDTDICGKPSGCFSEIQHIYCTEKCPHESLCGDRCNSCKWKSGHIGEVDSFDCKPGFSGWRCTLATTPTVKDESPTVNIDSHLVWIAIPMMSFFVVVILIMAVMLYRRKYSWIRASDLIGPNTTLYSRNSMTDADVEEVSSVESSEYHGRFIGHTNIRLDGDDDYITATDA